MTGRSGCSIIVMIMIISCCRVGEYLIELNLHFATAVSWVESVKETLIEWKDRCARPTEWYNKRLNGNVIKILREKRIIKTFLIIEMCDAIRDMRDVR